MDTVKVALVICSSFTLLLFFDNAFASSLEQHTKIWTSAVFIGPLTNNKKVKYYLEPELRFIDDKYKFEETLLYAGMGYQTTPNLILFFGDAWSTSKKPTGKYVNENRLWQQASWVPVDNNFFKLSSRTRLEERKNLSEHEWAINLRERLALEIPLRNWKNHALVLSDEVFFDLNHPKWVGNNALLSQNRGLIGISTKISKQTSFIIGYLNQYQFTNPPQMSHILYLSLNVTG